MVQAFSDRFLLPDESENYIPTAIERPLHQNPAPWKDLYDYIIVSLSTLPLRIVWKQNKFWGWQVSVGVRDTSKVPKHHLIIQYNSTIVSKIYCN